MSAGSIAAGDADEAAHRLQSRGLALIDDPREESGAPVLPRRLGVSSASRRRDRVHRATWRCCCAQGRGSTKRWSYWRATPAPADCGLCSPSSYGGFISGELFAEAIAKHPEAFPPIYGALVQVGEAAGSACVGARGDRAWTPAGGGVEARLADALRYPAFLLLGAGAVLLFFLLVVLPQFANVFRISTPSSTRRSPPSWLCRRLCAPISTRSLYVGGDPGGRASPSCAGRRRAPPSPAPSPVAVRERRLGTADGRSVLP